MVLLSAIGCWRVTAVSLNLWETCAAWKLVTLDPVLVLQKAALLGIL